MQVGALNNLAAILQARDDTGVQEALQLYPVIPLLLQKNQHCEYFFAAHELNVGV